MSERRRNLVVRPDGRLVNVARSRGQLFVCATGCCCGRTEDGFAPVPTDLYHAEWERRRLRNVVHLTVGGCLGPCALANGWSCSSSTARRCGSTPMNSDALVLALYDHIERDARGRRRLPAPPAALSALQFTASTWQPRPDGQPVDDHRPRRVQAVAAPATASAGGPRAAPPATDGPRIRPRRALHRLLADLGGSTAVPRRNGELVFDAPWQGRVFGMAVALSDAGLFPWEEFRQALIREVAAAEARGGRVSLLRRLAGRASRAFSRAGVS